MLTEVAFLALWRLSKGLPMFATPLPQRGLIGTGRWQMKAQARRDAVNELKRLRYVSRGRCGPEISVTGRNALEHLLALRRGEPAELSFAEIGERLGLSRGALNLRIVRLRKLNVEGLEPACGPRWRKWTPKEDEQIRERYAEEGAKWLGPSIGRSCGAVKQRRARIGATPYRYRCQT